MAEAEKITVGTSALAGILGVSDSRIRQLERSGIITKIGRGRYNLAAAVRGYCAYLKEAAGQPEGLSEKDLLDRTRRKKLELEIQIMQGELHRSQDVEREMNAMVAAFRARCLAIPTKVSPQLLGQADLAVVQSTLKREIFEALAELADYDPEMFYRHSKDKLVLDDGGDAEAPAKEQRRRGRQKK